MKVNLPRRRPGVELKAKTHIWVSSFISWPRKTAY